MGWALVIGAFAAVAAIVVWAPSLVVGLVVQTAATVALTLGVSMIFRGAAR
jgi:hypothetical protein